MPQYTFDLDAIWLGGQEVATAQQLLEHPKERLDHPPQAIDLPDEFSRKIKAVGRDSQGPLAHRPRLWALQGSRRCETAPPATPRTVCATDSRTATPPWPWEAMRAVKPCSALKYFKPWMSSGRILRRAAAIFPFGPLPRVFNLWNRRRGHGQVKNLPPRAAAHFVPNTTGTGANCASASGAGESCEKSVRTHFCEAPCPAWPCRAASLEATGK